MAWLAPVEGLTAAGSTCRRIAVAPGVEVLIDEQHPALRLNGDPAVIAEALRQALAVSRRSGIGPQKRPELGWRQRPGAQPVADSRDFASRHGQPEATD